MIAIILQDVSLATSLSYGYMSKIVTYKLHFLLEGEHCIHIHLLFLLRDSTPLTKT